LNENEGHKQHKRNRNRKRGNTGTHKEHSRGDDPHIRGPTFDLNDCYKCASFAIRNIIAIATGKRYGDQAMDVAIGEAVAQALPAPQVIRAYPDSAPSIYVAAGLWHWAKDANNHWRETDTDQDNF
jgi:hypothetical protein